MTWNTHNCCIVYQILQLRQHVLHCNVVLQQCILWHQWTTVVFVDVAFSYSPLLLSTSWSWKCSTVTMLELCTLLLTNINHGKGFYYVFTTLLNIPVLLTRTTATLIILQQPTRIGYNTLALSPTWCCHCMHHVHANDINPNPNPETNQ